MNILTLVCFINLPCTLQDIPFEELQSLSSNTQDKTCSKTELPSTLDRKGPIVMKKKRVILLPKPMYKIPAHFQKVTTKLS